MENAGFLVWFPIASRIILDIAAKAGYKKMGSFYCPRMSCLIYWNILFFYLGYNISLILE